MVSEKIIHYRIEPYFREAALQVVIDIILVICVLGVLVVAKFPLVISVAIVIGCFVIACAHHWRVPIQALIDRRKKDFITEIVSVQQFSPERSLFGDHLGYSYVRKFYPKQMHVDRCRIKVVDDCGKEKKLRSVMSFSRQLEFAVLDRNQVKYLQVIYLKRSKILIWCDLIEGMEKDLKRKGKDRVKKAIHTINISI